MWEDTALENWKPGDLVFRINLDGFAIFISAGPPELFEDHGDDDDAEIFQRLFAQRKVTIMLSKGCLHSFYASNSYTLPVCRQIN